jgi:tetratricopeptide (TPR) repeat protein
MRFLRFILVAQVFAASMVVAQERLDTAAMRNDLFAALSGNGDAVTRLVTNSERLLAANPDHPQALVWHGMTLLATGWPNSRMSSEERDAALARFREGVAEVDRAVELAPDDIEVRVMRGIAFRPISLQMPSPNSERMLEKARTDFQRIFDLQRDVLDGLGTHPLGELLQALGDIYARQSKIEEADRYYGLIEAKLPGTEYAARAALWRQTRQPLPPGQTSCIGCHAGAP